MSRADRSREALLDLDGQTVVLDEEGHVVRFSVKQVAVDRILTLREE